jgi:hypothetical protein
LRYLRQEDSMRFLCLSIVADSSITIKVALLEAKTENMIAFLPSAIMRSPFCKPLVASPIISEIKYATQIEREYLNSNIHVRFVNSPQHFS